MYRPNTAKPALQEQPSEQVKCSKLKVSLAAQVHYGDVAVLYSTCLYCNIKL